MHPLYWLITWIFRPLSIISAFVYIFFLFILIKYRKIEPFNGSFWFLCFPLGVADLGKRLNEIVLIDACLWDWRYFCMYDFEWANPAFSLFWNHLMRMAQDLGIINLIINRVTAAAKPFQYEQIWSGNKLKIAILVQWGAAFLVASPLLSKEVIPWATNDPLYGNITRRNSKMLDVRFWRKYRPIYTLFDIVKLSCFVISYLLIYFKMRGHRNKISTSTNASQKETLKKEIRLILSGLVFVLISMFVFLWNIYIVVTSVAHWPSFVRNLAIYALTINNLNCLANPFVLLITSKELRNRFIQTLLRY